MKRIAKYSSQPTQNMFCLRRQYLPSIEGSELKNLSHQLSPKKWYEKKSVSLTLFFDNYKKLQRLQF